MTQTYFHNRLIRFLFAALILLLAGCGSKTSAPPALGHAVKIRVLPPLVRYRHDPGLLKAEVYTAFVPVYTFAGTRVVYLKNLDRLTALSVTTALMTMYFEPVSVDEAADIEILPFVYDVLLNENATMGVTLFVYRNGVLVETLESGTPLAFDVADTRMGRSLNDLDAASFYLYKANWQDAYATTLSTRLARHIYASFKSDLKKYAK